MPIPISSDKPAPAAAPAPPTPPVAQEPPKAFDAAGARAMGMSDLDAMIRKQAFAGPITVNDFHEFESDVNEGLPAGLPRIYNDEPIYYERVSRGEMETNPKTRYLTPVSRHDPAFSRLPDFLFRDGILFTSRGSVVCFWKESVRQAFKEKRREPVRVRNEALARGFRKVEYGGANEAGQPVSGEMIAKMGPANMDKGELIRSI